MEHTHNPDGYAVQARAAVSKMKESIIGIGATPTSVIGESCRLLSDATLMRLPKKILFDDLSSELLPNQMP